MGLLGAYENLAKTNENKINNQYSGPLSIALCFLESSPQVPQWSSHLFRVNLYSISRAYMLDSDSPEGKPSLTGPLPSLRSCLTP